MKDENYITTDEITYNMLVQKIEKLQSNWNSLREWLIKKNDFYKNGITDYSENVINMVLDKMNELEGVDNENKDN